MKDDKWINTKDADIIKKMNRLFYNTVFYSGTEKEFILRIRYTIVSRFIPYKMHSR
jgi:hypothetical protein